MTWTHDDLAADLAGHLSSPERMTWQNMQLGPSGSPRPDVYALWKSYSKPNPTVFECKISKSDFRADVTTGKWRSYLDFAWSVVFAVPVGLISKEEVPEMCGLIVRHENAWRYAKKATVCPRTIDQEALLKLLIDGVKREGPYQRAEKWRQHEDGFAKKFGYEAARYVSDAATVHRRLEYAQEEVERIHKQAMDDAERIRKQKEDESPQQWTDLLDVLGLPRDAHRHHVRRRINDLELASDGSKEQRALKQIMRDLKHIVAQHEPLVTEPPSVDVLMLGPPA